VGLGEKEAESILTFCSGGKPGRVTAESQQRVVQIDLEGRARKFEGQTFEEALRAAAEAGLLRSSCVEKQIAFWGKHSERPRDVLGRVLMAELGVATGRAVERELAERVARPLAELELADLPDVAAAVELVLGLRLGPREAARVANRLLAEGRPATPPTSASPGALFELAKRIARVVHETQKERGATAVLLSGDGERFAAELGAQRAETDRWIADLCAFTTDSAAGWPPAVESRLGEIRHLARDASALRAGVDQRRTSPPHAFIDAYTDLNAALLEVIDLIAADAPDRLRVLGVAFTSLMWAKENVGRERAQLAVAFGLDHFAPGQIFKVGSLFGAQESFLRLFSTAAPRNIASGLKARLSEPPLREVRRLEAIALAHLDGGFGVDPAHWYHSMTRKVDLIGEVGDSVSALIAERAAE
jgi:hypothetical protein